MPTLLAYEQRQTTLTRGVYDAAIRVCVADQPTVADTLIDRVRDLRTLTRRTHSELSRLLPETFKHQWQEALYSRVYGTALEAVQTWITGQCQNALALPELSSEQRQDIQRMLADVLKQQDTSLMELADMFDQHAIFHAGPQGASAPEGYFDTLNSVHQRTLSQSVELQKKLLAILGEQHFKQIRRVARPQRTRTRRGLRLACGIVAIVSFVDPEPVPSHRSPTRSDPLVGMPISPETMNDYLASLRLDSVRREAALAAYQEYVARLEKDLEGRLTTLMELTILAPPPGQANADPEQKAREIAELRMSIRKSIAAADAQLFQELTSTLHIEIADAAWQRVLRMRHRARMALDVLSYYAPDFNRAAEIDLVQLLAREVGPVFEPTLDTLAQEYESQLLDQLRSLRELSETHSFETRSRAGRAVDQDSHARTMEQSEELHRRFAALGELNAAYLPKFLHATPAAASTALAEAYHRQAFPKVFAEADRAILSLTAALDMADLSDSQRLRLIAVRAQHADARATVQTRMIDLCAALSPTTGMMSMRITPERAAKIERFEQTWAQLSDQRATISRRTLRELRTILTQAEWQDVAIQVDK